MSIEMIAMMDAIVVVTGLLRLCLVIIVFYLNCRTLLVVCFRSSLCAHNLVSTAVVLANILYLITWPPFLVYGLSVNGGSGDGRHGWTAVNEQVFCLSQNYVVNAMGMVLLSLLVVRLTDRVRESVLCWPALGCTRNVLFTFLMWLLPQLVYDLVSLATNGNACARQNERRTRPVFHFLGEIVRIVSPTAASSVVATTAGYSLGFMVCEQELTDVVVAFHLWQYLVLVVPYAVAALVFGALISMSASLRRRHRRLGSTGDHFPYLPMAETSTEDGCDDGYDDVETRRERTPDDEPQDDECGDHCKRRMVVVDLILYGNILWHLLGRPLVILHTLYWTAAAAAAAAASADGQTTSPPTFLDIGSHLMLAVSCCFAPTICSLGSTAHPTARSVLVSVLRVNNKTDCGSVKVPTFIKSRPTCDDDQRNFHFHAKEKAMPPPPPPFTVHPGFDRTLNV